VIPFVYMPPPQPVQQIVVQQPAPVAQILAPRRGYKPPVFNNRRERRAYQAAVLRRLRHTLFTKTDKAAMPHLVSVRNCRTELKGLI
jgi:hypothetical protein